MSESTVMMVRSLEDSLAHGPATSPEFLDT